MIHEPFTINHRLINETFDYIVYLRPDVRYLNSIDIRYFHNTHKNRICTPNFHLFPQLNDRLAILKPCNLKEYSEMFNEMYECTSSGLPSLFKAANVLKKSHPETITITSVFHMQI